MAKKLTGGNAADPADAAKGFANVRQFLQDVQQAGGPAAGASSQSVVQTSASTNVQNGVASTDAPRIDITV